MANLSTSEFETLIEKATSESIPNGDLDLPTAMEISDIVRSKRIPHKDAMKSLKKRIVATASNPNTQLSSWKLTDICVKNGGMSFIKEICSREFMDAMENAILKNEDFEEVQELVIRIFYELYLAFKNDSQLNYVARVYEKLKNRDIEFPVDSVDPNTAVTLFDTKTPADWNLENSCMICDKSFSMFNRRHHCRSCGSSTCQEHSSHSIPLPDLGIYDHVRVCDNCYDDYEYKTNKYKPKKHSKKHGHKHKSSHVEEDDEDEQLRKAIELSLKENKESTEPPIPVVKPVETEPEEIEDDPDLKAAIEASLREAEQAKQRQQFVGTRQYNNAASNPQRLTPTYNPPTMSAEDENDIYLFASMVEKMKFASSSEIIENNNSQALYQKILQTKAKLNHVTNDTVHKYNTFVDMNGKISNVMNNYDTLLERQLSAINISQQYQIPQNTAPSYAINEQSTSNQMPQDNRSYHTVKEEPPRMQPAEQTLLNRPAPVITIAQRPSADLAGLVIDDKEPQSMAQIPSEPSYLNDSVTEEDIPNEKSDETAYTEATSIEGERDPLPETSGEIKEVSETRNITQFDFPTVPANKTKLPKQPEESEPSVEEPDEELLLEL